VASSVKFLSIHAPWAQLIALGIKDVENRGWSTSHRGPLAIHCTKGGWAERDVEAILEHCVAERLIRYSVAARVLERCEADRGKIIAIAEVTGCRSSDGHPSPWAIPGGHVFELAHARLVVPTPVRGGLGLLNLERKVARQLHPLLDLHAYSYVPDVIEASDAWGANCGPTALAAALHTTMEAIKPAVAPDGTFKGHMGVRDFKAAIDRAGAKIVRTWSKPDKRELLRTTGEPILVLIRFCGPWDDIENERIRARVQAAHRHAFVYRHGIVGGLDRYGQREHGPGWVYDCNNLLEHPEEKRLVASWLPLQQWREHVLPTLVPEKGTGETAIDWMAQVERGGVSPKRSPQATH
jgi:hypothetical protein